MLTTDFVPGSPCWIDLGAPDVAAAGAFYSAVFGWAVESFGPEADGFSFFRVDGKAVGAVGRLTEPGARSAWTVYFSTAELDALAEAVRQAGGIVRVAPAEVGKEGRLAQFTDPQGGRFAAWQASEMAGLELTDAPGSLCWTELYTTDAAAAKQFYGGLFGWQSSDVAMPGGEGTYSLLTPAGLPPERQFGGLLELAPEDLALTGGLPYWHPVFTVADCDATLAKATANGGTLQMGPVDAPGIGRMAICVDPAGADFVLLTPPKE
ncbi:VOC family protein [Kitasatospora sp. NBC_01266]|uniref:VOC family protein n=1 Tax=Kitasatospora sp. NBC_01266 TaxID=2903572 RepID=UPI002E3696A0|nr:VOC family protein [Kitasatospora sp. NBC_01266]